MGKKIIDIDEFVLSKSSIDSVQAIENIAFFRKDDINKENGIICRCAIINSNEDNSLSIRPFLQGRPGMTASECAMSNHIRLAGKTIIIPEERWESGNSYLEKDDNRQWYIPYRYWVNLKDYI